MGPGPVQPVQALTGVVTLLFTDVVSSTTLKQRLGDKAGAALIQEQRALVRHLLTTYPGAEEIETAGDSFLLWFPKPSDAVRFALVLQSRLHSLNQGQATPLRDRIGIHLGEVVIEQHEAGHKPKDLYGLQIDTCARVMSLAKGGQVLMSRGVFDNARQVLKGEDIPGIGALEWLNHGPYLLKGIEEPVEICEVRETGKEVLSPPTSSEKAQRQARPDEEPVLGWRPAVGQVVPNTPWRLEEKLGEGGFGEVWVGRHPQLKERRVFKFCFRANRVRALKREMTLFRLLKEHVGDHPNIVRLHEVYLDESPFYLEEEFVEGKDLRTWCEAQGGVEKVPQEARLEIIAQAAEALQAAHDAGVIHRDVKPGNILVAGDVSSGKQLSVKLTDFGIGQVVSQEYLAGVTKAGFTMTLLGSESSSHTGTQLYMAPELLAGKPSSIRSDIYSLGVVLYQLLVGDFTRPVATDWANEIPQALLREDLRLCFAGKPEGRFAGVAQLGKSLRALPERQADLARREAEQAERQRLHQQAEKRRRQFHISGAVATVLVALALTLGYGLRKAERARRAEAREAYYSSIGLADAQIEKGDINIALETLFKCAPEYRNWEWGRLLFLCYQDVLSCQAQEPVWPDIVGSTVLQPTRLMSFSPDGDCLATSGRDGSLKVWNSTNANLVFSFGSTSNPANVFAWRPDGRHLAAGMSNHLIRVWNTESWQEVLTLTGHTSPVSRLVYSPSVSADAHNQAGAQPETGDSKSGLVLLATASANGPVKVWDAKSGQERYTLRDHPRPIAELWFSPDGQRLIVRSVTSVGGDVGLYRASDGTPIQGGVPPHSEATLLAAPAGEAWLTIDGEGRLKLWRDTSQAAELVTIKGIQPGRLRRVFFSPDGTKFCNGGEEGTARVWETRSGRELLTIPCRVYAAVFSPDGSRLVTLGAEHLVHLWDLATGREMRVLRGHSALVDEATFSPDGRLIATRGADGVVKLWSALLGREVLQDDPSWIIGVSSSPDGRRIFSHVWEIAFNVWDAETGQVLIKTATGKHWITASAFSPDGRRVVTVGRDRDRVARVWDVETGQQLMALAGHQRSAMDVAYSPDGRWIATGSWDGTARLWEADTGRAARTLNCQATGSWSLSFSPDSRHLATAAGDLVQLWEVPTGKPIWTRKVGPTAWVQYFPQGKRLLVSRPDEGLIEVWDAATGAPRLAWTLPGRPGGRLSPDGKRLVTTTTASGGSGFDRPLLGLLDVETGRILLTWQGHSELGWGWFNQDGRHVVSCSTDCTIRQWASFPWREEEYAKDPGRKTEHGWERKEVGSQRSAKTLPERVRAYADGYWRARLVAEKRGRDWAALHPTVVRPGFEEVWRPRDPQATEYQIDLTKHYTGQLDFDFNPHFELWAEECNLAELPSGSVTFDGVVFDVRGVIQLRKAEVPGGPPWNRAWDLYPMAVKGIRAGRPFHRLHVLHAASCVGSGRDWSGPDGATIASYVLHYADGQQHAFDVVYGQDVREWFDMHVAGETETTRGKVVWRGSTPLAKGWGASLRLYLSTWNNPRPEVEVTSIDYVSKLAAPAPFLVAMTIEP